MRHICLCIMCIMAALACSAQEYSLSASRRHVRTSTDVVNIGMATATVAGVLIAKDWQGLKECALSAVSTVGVSYILKYSIRKDRPDHSDYHSFPSNHSAVAFVNAGFLMRRYGWKFGVPAYALACYTAWGRTYAKRHDWWDVAAGAAIGTAAAYLFTKPYMSKHNIAIAPCATPHMRCITASITF